uniref:Putative secreted protein n=1 Tax=Anopheles darlingi TaxID=43151 RepID=A0A2M4D579_ANODA
MMMIMVVVVVVVMVMVKVVVHSVRSILFELRQDFVQQFERFFHIIGCVCFESILDRVCLRHRPSYTLRPA